MNEPLKPCPFCGGEVTLTDTEDNYVGRRCFIRCDNCEISTAYADHREYPIASWNTRADAPQHTGSCPLCDQRAELEQTHVLVSKYDLLNLYTDCLAELRDLAAHVPEGAVEKHDFWGSVKRLDDAYLALIGTTKKEQDHG